MASHGSSLTACSLLAAAPTSQHSRKQLTKPYAPTRAQTVPTHAVKQHTRPRHMAHVVKPQRAPACSSPAAFASRGGCARSWVQPPTQPQAAGSKSFRGTTTGVCCIPTKRSQLAVCFDRSRNGQIRSVHLTYNAHGPCRQGGRERKNKRHGLAEPATPGCSSHIGSCSSSPGAQQKQPMKP
jgi:hypothetical protein